MTIHTVLPATPPTVLPSLLPSVLPTPLLVTRPEVDAAGLYTSVALVNCLIREIAAPAGRCRIEDGWAVLDLPGAGCVLRAELTRSSIAEPRPSGRVYLDSFLLSWRGLAEIIGRELSGQTGVRNQALVEQISGSHAFVSAVLARRPAAISDPEQALVTGHRFHPAPKARSGSLRQALRYAPEVGADFQLRYLSVPPEFLWERGDPGVFEPSLLPVHPWQWAILDRSPRLAAALRAGLVDLGVRGPVVRPTSSVRTVDTGTGFLKLSLGVRLTNCLRLNRQPELEAAVALDGYLEPLRAALARRYPGTRILHESAARTVDLGSLDPAGRLADQLGVIAREPLRLPAGVRPVLSAALVEPLPFDPALLRSVTRDRAGMLDWWGAYLDRLVPPVLRAFFEHGIVFEAHLQNVVMGLDARTGSPTHLVLRDLEGVKLVGPQHTALLAGLPRAVAAHLAYDRQRGWERVAYCLFLNHLTGILGLLGDRDPGADRLLWARVRDCLRAVLRDVGDAPELRAVLSGRPLPAKTNLLTRWRDSPDRDSGYVPVPLPLGDYVR